MQQLAPTSNNDLPSFWGFALESEQIQAQLRAEAIRLVREGCTNSRELSDKLNAFFRERRDEWERIVDNDPSLGTDYAFSRINDFGHIDLGDRSNPQDNMFRPIYESEVELVVINHIIQDIGRSGYITEVSPVKLEDRHVIYGHDSHCPVKGVPKTIHHFKPKGKPFDPDRIPYVDPIRSDRCLG